MARSGLADPLRFFAFRAVFKENMLLDLFVNIVGPIAEKRYPAVRKAVRWSSAVFLGAFALYVAYSFFAS